MPGVISTWAHACEDRIVAGALFALLASAIRFKRLRARRRRRAAAGLNVRTVCTVPGAGGEQLPRRATARDRHKLRDDG